MGKVLAVAVLLFSSVFAAAQGATGTCTTQPANHHCTVILPPKTVPLSGELIVTLHGTKYAACGNPPDASHLYGWDYACKQKGAGCVVVSAGSTWDPDVTSSGDKTGYWVWNAQFFDGMVFSPPPSVGTYPDDVSFLRKLITDNVAEYNLDPHKVYVVGFSTGAFMAARVAVELSDLVAAVSINSGGLHSTIGTVPVISMPNPVSVLEYHGTIDNNTSGVDPCSNVWSWNQYDGKRKPAPEKATVDDTFNFFATQNGCTVRTTTTPLCQGFTNNDATSHQERHLGSGSQIYLGSRHRSYVPDQSQRRRPGVFPGTC